MTSEKQTERNTQKMGRPDPVDVKKLEALHNNNTNQAPFTT